jgi:predicted CoA-binding protein
MPNAATTADATDIRHVLQDLDTWAVVGCSSDPSRASHEVASFLRTIGKRVVPVNPNEVEVLGERCYADLAAVAADGLRVDVVDIFRRSSEAGAHVDEAIAVGAAAVWMQLGVVDDAAAARAHDAGIVVVMDRCPKIEWPRLRR